MGDTRLCALLVSPKGNLVISNSSSRLGRRMEIAGTTQPQLFPGKSKHQESPKEEKSSMAAKISL